MRKSVALYSLILLSLVQVAGAFAYNVQIRVLSDAGFSKIVFKADVGNYVIFSGSSIVSEVDENRSVQVDLYGSSLRLISGGETVGTFPSLRFKSGDSIRYFGLSYPSASAKKHLYDDDLEIYPDNGVLKLINVVGLDHYVAGVIESEIGHIYDKELLKVQAIISRTYVLGHLQRHAAEGFSLCDKTHCQVYHGKSRYNPLVSMAVAGTSGLIIVDDAFQPIQAAFHSNCGGQTCNAEDVWSKPVSYLRSIKDTFCLSQPHAFWEKRLSLKQWKNYLSDKVNQKVNEPCLIEMPVRRSQLDCYPVAMKDIRSEFGLRSTFFSIDRSGDELILHGRGFGHGVGMCQEGAVRMAQLGYSFDQIITFYYTGVQIIDVSSWNLIDN